MTRRRRKLPPRPWNEDWRNPDMSCLSGNSPEYESRICATRITLSPTPNYTSDPTYHLNRKDPNYAEHRRTNQRLQAERSPSIGGGISEPYEFRTNPATHIHDPRWSYERDSAYLAQGMLYQRVAYRAGEFLFDSPREALQRQKDAIEKEVLYALYEKRQKDF